MAIRTRPEEGELIKEATEYRVPNIVQYYYHETVQVGGKNDDTMENVRKGLMKVCGRRNYRQRLKQGSESPATESSEKAVAGRNQSRSTLRKRTLEEAAIAPRSDTKRSCSGPQSKDKSTPIYNRVHRRVIIKDAGEPIYKASSLLAIINGFIRAICGHESLLNAGILYRDISMGNIMLTEKKNDGILIDLDLAIKISNTQASGAPSKTGTKVFMAIGTLLGEQHNFMHDLESFFWVLFWICIHYDLDKNRKAKGRTHPQYEKWNYTATEELATIKAGKISRHFFDKVDTDFTEHYRPLFPCVKELHRVVFLGGAMWEGEHRELHSEMKGILEKAKDSLQSKTTLLT